MIKFFRHIRQQLIRDNKMGKYFKYAIGEIVLVVIGILIALQINNWNEQQKLHTEESQLLASIKSDLNSDIVLLEQLLKDSRKGLKSLIDLRDKISHPTFSLDSLEYFALNKIDVFLTAFEGFNNNSYQSAKSSGKVEIIRNSLKKELYDLSVKQISAEKTYNTYYNIYLNQLIDFNKEYPLKTPVTFINSGAVNDLMWSKVNRKQLALKLNDWGTAKINLYRLLIQRFYPVLEKTKAVLILMENND